MKGNGFTLIEFLIALMIIVFIAGAVLWSLNSFRSRQAVKNAKSEIISALNLARTRAISGLDDKVHGVYFESSQMIIYSGVLFIGATSNQTVSFPLVSLTTNLAGGQRVVFSRLTGATTNFGTVVINSLTGNNTATVTVLSTGSIADE